MAPRQGRVVCSLVAGRYAAGRRGVRHHPKLNSALSRNPKLDLGLPSSHPVTATVGTRYPALHVSLATPYHTLASGVPQTRYDGKLTLYSVELKEVHATVSYSSSIGPPFIWCDLQNHRETALV